MAAPLTGDAETHCPMKALPFALGACVLLLLSALYFQHRQTTALHAQITDFVRDRAETRQAIQKLTSQLAVLQARSAADPRPSMPEVVTAEAVRSSVPAATPPPTRVARPGVTVTAPAGWGKNGAKADMYVVGVDSTNMWGGMPSAYVESLTPSVEAAFGGMMQTTAAANYVGKRVRLSGWIKTEDANQGGGHLWLRIDGQERGQILGFDNMNNRAVKGTSDWQEASVVLDVPAGSRALAYGFFVEGGGKMWVNGQRIEEVGMDVPTTNMPIQIPATNAPPVAPRNLGFDPNAPKG